MSPKDHDYIDLDQVRRRAKQAWRTPTIAESEIPPDLRPLPIIDPLRWQDATVPERRWIVPGLIPECQVTLLGGDGGLGKSLIAIQLLVACALGKAWVGHDARPCKVIGVFCEDDADEIHRRVGDVLRFYDASFSDLEHLTLLSRVGEENQLLEYSDQWTAGKPTAFYDRIKELVLDRGIELLILDSLHDFFAGNENSRPQARQFIGELRKIAVAMRGAVVLTAHPSLSGRNTGTGEAGSTAWNNAVRSRLYLTAPRQDDDASADRDYRELRTKKSNYSGNGDVTRLRWRDGVFVREDANSPTGIVATIELENSLLAVLRSRIVDGARVAADPKARNGLANVARETPSCRKYSWSALCAAQARLIENGKIVRVEIGPKSRRYVFLRTPDLTYPGETEGTSK